MFLTESGVQLLLMGVRVRVLLVWVSCTSLFSITEISTCNVKIRVNGSLSRTDLVGHDSLWVNKVSTAVL